MYLLKSSSQDNGSRRLVPRLQYQDEDDELFDINDDGDDDRSIVEPSQRAKTSRLSYLLKKLGAKDSRKQAAIDYDS